MSISLPSLKGKSVKCSLFLLRPTVSITPAQGMPIMLLYEVSLVDECTTSKLLE